jgi:hypothetical protein
MDLDWNVMEFLKLRLIKVEREIGSGGEAKVYEAQVQDKGASVVKVPKWSEGRDDHDDRCLSELLYIKYEPEDFAHFVRKWIDYSSRPCQIVVAVYTVCRALLWLGRTCAKQMHCFGENGQHSWPSFSGC